MAGWACIATFAMAKEPGRLRVLAQGGPAEQRMERRVVVQATADAGENEKVAFLGVETAPVSPALTAQLGLPKGTGLVVRQVVEKSPATEVLREHDVLLKFEDQILIDPRQFSVLVRNRNVGDEVELTYVRGGKEAKARVKLAEREMPKRQVFGFGGGNVEDFDVLMTAPESAVRRQEARQVLSLLDHRGGHGEVVRPMPPSAGLRAFRMSPENSSMVYTDERGTLEITIKDGRKTLIAKDAKGDQLYSGAVDTPEQRGSLPEDVRCRLEQVEGMRGFSFEIDDEFRAGEGPHPLRQKISRPFPGMRVLRGAEEFAPAI